MQQGKQGGLLHMLLLLLQPLLRLLCPLSPALPLPLLTTVSTRRSLTLLHRQTTLYYHHHHPLPSILASISPTQPLSLSLCRSLCRNCLASYFIFSSIAVLFKKRKKQEKQEGKPKTK